MINNSKVNIKPFSFQLPQTQEFNSILLDNVDLDYIESTGDISNSASFLRNFVQAKITSDTIKSLQFEQFDKMLKICQQGMAFYTQNQEQKEQQLEEKLQELQSKQEQLQQLKEIEQKHDEKQITLNKEISQLKTEYQRVKDQKVKKIIFKCHHCDKYFENKDTLYKHIQSKHVEIPKDDITNPEFLTRMMQQITSQSSIQQQQQQQQQQSYSQSQQIPQQQSEIGNGQYQKTFGTTFQTSPDYNTFASTGFQQLRDQHREKLEMKQKRREERRIRREQDREERLKRLQVQEQQMKLFQSKISTLVDQKIQDMIHLHKQITSQQQNQLEEQKKLMIDIEELKQMRFAIRPEQSEIEIEKSESNKEDQQLIKQFEQPDYDLSQQSLDSNQLSKDQKLLINKNQQAADESGMVSFQNYSETINSAIQMKQQNDNIKGMGGGKKELIQGEMAHIGEIESDDDDLNQQQGSFLRPLNKKGLVKFAEEELIKQVYKKDQESQQSEEQDVEDLDSEIQQERFNILGDEDQDQGNKELKQSLYKVQQRNKEIERENQKDFTQK